ncbi:two-component system response regulator YesN [Lachnospiraceae bacterium PF1-21]|uniref:response regulator transcription factor n=1 Tax=Ohessyouella blattaphilus TaxID=2949333 RepID=UPI003E27A9BC
MYKILIVEDEILARIGLRQLLDWERSGFALLKDATDGEEAIISIKKYQPDIILLDLNIPKINGLEILSFLKREKISAQVIVISCHEEFEMVKEAMKLGAFDYLRKLNLSGEELQDILCKAVQEREKREFPNISTIELRYEEIVDGFGGKLFATQVVYRTICCIMVEELNNFFEIIKIQLMQSQKNYVHIRKSEKISYLLFEEELSLEFIHGIFDELISQVREELYVGVYKGTMVDIHSLNTAISIVEQIQLLSYYDEKVGVIELVDKIDVKNHSPQGIYKREEILNQCINDFKMKEAKKELERIFELIRQNKYVDVFVLRRIFMELLGFFSMKAQSFDKTIEVLEVGGSSCHYQKLMLFDCLNDVETWFYDFLNEFGCEFSLINKFSQSELLWQVYNYLENHINETIHLGDVADAIGVSGAYLSTIFKKEIGINFIEYVNIRKVNVAKEMLGMGYKVQDISEAIGFENSTYFSKVFKKYIGVSPARYKIQCQKN